MTDAVAFHYIGRPDDTRTEELLFRDYVKADNPRLTDAQRKARAPTTPWGKVLANFGVVTGAAVLASYATSVVLDGSIVINGQPMSVTFVEALQFSVPTVWGIWVLFALLVVFVGGDRR